MVHLRVAACSVCCMVLPMSAYAGDASLRDRAATSLKKAVGFLRREVATEGGYLWRYSADLKRREGEGVASATTVWVQPPGTPSVGAAYFEAYQATGDAYYLQAAREAAMCLVRGQLRSGGWAYRIEFDPSGRKRYAYRVEKHEGGSNTSTLDDDTTQSALRLLMRVDRARDFKDEKIHDAASCGLKKLIEAQYPNGAWPQRFSRAPDPEKFPVKKAGYPDTWFRKFRGRGYRSFYTFNDNTIVDAIETMLEAARIYGDDRYRASALKAGGFILLAQMPDPQPAWAQQYNVKMQPAWARRFEPPAITGGESYGVMQGLLTLYRETGDKTFLEPIPRALAYFERSRLADGRLARFYELKTNKPLYFTSTYELTYSDADMPTHYAFKVPWRMDRIAAEYERLRAMSPEALKAATRPARAKLTPQLISQATAAIAALDGRGRWVEEGRLGYQDFTGHIIDCGTFIRNVRTLSRYLAATRPGETAPS